MRWSPRSCRSRRRRRRSSSWSRWARRTTESVALSLDGQQIAGLDRLEGERAVADLFEQDGDAVFLLAHDDPRSPLRMPHARLYAEPGVDIRPLLGRAGRAGVAGVTQTRQLLAEVAEQERAAAVLGLGVPAHHLDPGQLDRPHLLGFLGGGRDGL